MSDGSRPAESAEIDGSGIGASGGANKIGGERSERREQGRQLGWEGRGACRTAGRARAGYAGGCADGLGAERRGGAAERASRVDGGGDGGFGTGVEPALTIANRRAGAVGSDCSRSGGWGARGRNRRRSRRARRADATSRSARFLGVARTRGTLGSRTTRGGGAAAVQTCSTGRRNDQPLALLVKRGDLRIEGA